MSDSESDKEEVKSVSAAHQERLERFRRLKEEREKALADNIVEVTAETARLKEDPREAAKKARTVAEGKELLARKEAVQEGKDYDRIKSWDVTIEEAQERAREKERKEEKKDVGFSSYEESSLRKYNRLTGELKPNLDDYVRQKAEMGEDFYPGLDNLTYGFYNKVPESKIDELVKDLRKQTEKRKEFSRRRRYDDTDDVDYINERNARFNKKIARAFDSYTKEIKGNLERGTAL